MRESFTFGATAIMGAEMMGGGDGRRNKTTHLENTLRGLYVRTYIIIWKTLMLLSAITIHPKSASLAKAKKRVSHLIMQTAHSS